jgi:Phage integrase family
MPSGAVHPNRYHGDCAPCASSAGRHITVLAAFRLQDADDHLLAVDVAGSQPVVGAEFQGPSPDRFVGDEDTPLKLLPAEILDLLRQWWKRRPTKRDAGVAPEQRWLFPGRIDHHPTTTRQFGRLFKQAAKAAGLRKAVSLHALRHSFATHLLENGKDIRLIQALLGHEKLDTTARYTRVATGIIAKIESPIARLSAPRRKPPRRHTEEPAAQ